MPNFLTKGYESLGANINKVLGRSDEAETQEGIVSEKIPELDLKMSNEKLSELTTTWEKTWIESEVCSEWKEAGTINEKYWKGKQHNQPKIDTSRPIMDNVIFESLETYLPRVIRRNPDPMVTLARKEEQSSENLQFALELQKDLGEFAEELVLKLKLKKAGRHWAIYLLGVAKMGWDLDRDIPTTKILRPTKIILDPEATIDEDGYTGEYIGEHRKLSASVMESLLEEVGGEADGIAELKKVTTKKGKKAGGTMIGFIEWWTSEFMCWTLNGKVLLKKKNPHWNYGTEKDAPFTAQGEPQLNEDGTKVMEEVPGVNHFMSPKKPYVFLSVFNLGKKPVDETSLIGQNLANQDLINKRNKQIDKNADSMNGGMVVSGERSGLTKKQASQVTVALRKGGTVWIPSGSVQDAVYRMSASGLPADVFNQLADTRDRVRDIFGTRGSSAAGLQSEKTVRGKFQNKELDTDRIGGGVSEYLEQFADQIYNWFVQLLYVYDDNYINKVKVKIKVGVKEGSLLPKDATTMANQAIDLATSAQMSFLDLYKKLDYPNPEELAANMWLQLNAPEVLFANDPRVQQVIQSRQENSQPEETPNESVNYKDLPPEGKIQMLAKLGINIDPASIVAKEEEENKSNIPVPKVN